MNPYQKNILRKLSLTSKFPKVPKGRREDYGDGYFSIFDKNGNEIYSQNTNNHYWTFYKYDEWGNQIYWEDNNGEWGRREYDAEGNIILSEDSDDEWVSPDDDEEFD